jgi:hypothetical protein
MQFCVSLQQTFNQLILSLCGIMLLGTMMGSAAAAETIKILPEKVTLSTTVSQQQLIVQVFEQNEFRAQMIKDLVWTSSNPEIVSIENGLLSPHQNGHAKIKVTQGELTAEINVAVTGQEHPHEWNFRKDVLPILSHKDCNSGGCHGALAGKGGFRLSLRGYDPESDFFNIVQQDRGRRIEFAAPEQSLFVSKPTAAIPHKGGLKFDQNSHDYRVLSEWIAHGAPAPSPQDPTVQFLEVYPSQSLHQIGESQQYVVCAHYSNGQVEDVTPRVKWNSTNETVCQITPEGKSNMIGSGEGAIVAWYDSKIVLARTTVPFKSPAQPATATDDRKPKNLIDELVDQQLKRLNLVASPGCSDLEFVRRVYVDTIGRLPSIEETTAFLVKTEANKRDLLIDQLLKSSDFSDYWTYKWSDILMLNGTILRPLALNAYYNFVHDHVVKNTPWDQFVREIMTATGDSTTQGATNFFAVNQTPEEMTENACQAFMGLSIGCAKCHNHPLEKWTNDQYYGMANMFSRVKAKGWGGESRNGDGLRTLYVTTSGELVQPRTGLPQAPAPLDSAALSFDSDVDRRIEFARWLTSAENPYFARAVTNRIWANYFGVGLVESVDDLRISNPASNEPLLAAATKYFVDKKFDVKELMKLILQSNAYQRTSVAVAGNEDDKRYYSRYFPRRMMAEVLHDAIVQVTQVPTKFDTIAFPGNDKQKTTDYPLGTRSIQLHDSAVESYFLESFGRNDRKIVCECERTAEPTLVQVLHISNGTTINDKLKAPTSQVSHLVELRKLGAADNTLLDEIYMSSLSRYPTATERKELTALMPPVGSHDEHLVLEDIYWGILSSREFLFNH